MDHRGSSFVPYRQVRLEFIDISLIKKMSVNECYERFKMGAFMGATVGASMGILFGTYSIFRFGHGGAGAIRVIGKTALESGGLFGLLMGVGGLIRCNDFPLSSLDDNGNDHFVSITAPPFLSSSCRLHVLETAADNFGHLKHLIHATTTGIFSNSSVPSTADVRERQWKNDFMYYVNRKF